MEFLRDGLLEKKLQLVGTNILLILLSPELGCYTGREYGDSGGSDGGDGEDPQGVDRVQVRVTLEVPPRPVVEEERMEAGLPVLPSGGAHGSPAWSELEGAGGATTGPEVEQPPVSYGVLVVDIPFDGK